MTHPTHPSDADAARRLREIRNDQLKKAKRQLALFCFVAVLVVGFVCYCTYSMVFGR